MRAGDYAVRITFGDSETIFPFKVHSGQQASALGIGAEELEASHDEGSEEDGEGAADSGF